MLRSERSEETVGEGKGFPGKPGMFCRRRDIVGRGFSLAFSYANLKVCPTKEKPKT